MLYYIASLSLPTFNAPQGKEGPNPPTGAHTKQVPGMDRNLRALSHMCVATFLSAHTCVHFALYLAYLNL